MNSSVLESLKSQLSLLSDQRVKQDLVLGGIIRQIEDLELTQSLNSKTTNTSQTSSPDVPTSTNIINNQSTHVPDLSHILNRRTRKPEVSMVETKDSLNANIKNFQDHTRVKDPSSATTSMDLNYQTTNGASSINYVSSGLSNTSAGNVPFVWNSGTNNSNPLAITSDPNNFLPMIMQNYAMGINGALRIGQTNKSQLDLCPNVWTTGSTAVVNLGDANNNITSNNNEGITINTPQLKVNSISLIPELWVGSLSSASDNILINRVFFSQGSISVESDNYTIRFGIINVPYIIEFTYGDNIHSDTYGYIGLNGTNGLQVAGNNTPSVYNGSHEQRYLTVGGMAFVRPTNINQTISFTSTGFTTPDQGNGIVYIRQLGS
jgi:hypothetical protein